MRRQTENVSFWFVGEGVHLLKRAFGSADRYAGFERILNKVPLAIPLFNPHMVGANSSLRKRSPLFELIQSNPSSEWLKSFNNLIPGAVECEFGIESFQVG